MMEQREHAALKSTSLRRQTSEAFCGGNPSIWCVFAVAARRGISEKNPAIFRLCRQGAIPAGSHRVNHQPDKRA